MAIQSKFFVVLIVTLVILLNMGVNADVPHLISYQGRILDSRTGEPVPDGLYDFTFRLYGDEFTDYAFWTEIHQSVQVSNGLYNIILGSVTPFGNFDFSTQYWLGVQVGMDDEMTPRYQLSASPYALSIADDAITTQKIQDGTITQDDLHGRLVFAEIVDEEGEYKFALTKHNPKLQIIGNVEFDEENHAIAISGGNSNNGGKGSEWTRSGTIVHLTNSGDSVGIGTSNPSYQLDVTDEIGIGEASTATGKIHFRNSTSGTEVTIQSGVTTSDYSLTLPTSQGDTGYVIVNDGAGNLSWSELNDSDWVYLPDSSYMYAKKSAGSNTYARIYDSGESQVLDVLHPINSHGEYAIRGRSDSTGAYGVLGYFDSLYGGFGVLGEAGPDGVVGVAGICSTNIGALGTDGEGVYGQGDKIGGNFTPTVRIVPQDSVPINTDGALYVKNNGIDTLYFNDDSTGWVPILTGPHGLQEAYESGNNVEMSVVSGDIRMFIPAPPLPPGLPPIDLLFLDASSGYVGIGDTTPSYKLDVSGEIGLGVASESAGKIHFRNSTSATEVTIQSGITDSSYTIILPTNQGDAEQVMKNDGSGNLSWADLNDGDWTVNPLENYIFATQADSLTSYVRIYDKNQSQTMDVSHPTKADGQYAIKGLSDSTGAFGILGYFDTSYGGYGVFGDAGSNGFVGVAGVKSNNIGALGTDSEGVYGEGDEVGGKFLPAISIVPQDSQPGNLNGGLYVKNAAIDTLYFYDDTTGWVPVLVGPFGLQEAYNDGDEIELTPSKGDIRIYGTSPYAELLYLNASNGYVGIGDTTPSYKLDVDGKGRFTDSLTIGTDSSYTFPIIDGAANQVLKTDGSGNLSWTNLDAANWTDLPESNYIYATQTDSSNSYVRIYDKGQPQVLDVLHPVGAHGEYAIRGGSDSTATYGALALMDTAFGVFGVYGSSGGTSGSAGVGGFYGGVNYGFLGVEEGGVYGVGNVYGGYFSPVLGIEPQSSVAPFDGAVGGLLVKDSLIDTLYFYNDSTGWVPVLTGPFGLQEAYKDGKEIEMSPVGGDIRIHSAEELLYLDASDGYVGIGDTTPSYKLDVDGKGRFTDSLTIGTDSSYTFPIIDGAANQVLITDGSGNLSWTDLNAFHWTDLPDSHYIYATQTDSTNSYVRIYDNGQSQALDVLHPVNSHSEYAIRGSSDSTGAYGVLAYFDSIYGGFGVFGQSGENGNYGVVGVKDGNDYGALGMDERGVYGVGSVYGGYFDPVMGIEPQSSAPSGAAGGLYVKNSLIDTLYFYDDSTDWVPVLTGPFSLQEAYKDGNEIELTAQNGDIRMYSTSPPSELLFLETQTGNVGIGDTTPSYKLDVAGEIGIGEALNQTGRIHFRDSSGTAEVTIQPGETSSSYSLTLPVSQGDTGQVMMNDGSGNFYWSDINDSSVWVDLPDSNYIYASQADSSNSYIRIYDKGQSQALDVLHPVDSHGEYAIRARSDSTGTFGILGYYDTLYGSMGVYGQADTSESEAIGIMGMYDENNYGVLGSKYFGVGGIGTSCGGIFYPSIVLVQQDSVPYGVGGALYVKNNTKDTLFFYDDSTGWNPILSGSFTLQKVYEEGGNNIELDTLHGDLRIYLEDTTVSNREVVYLDSYTGYIGIGDTTPSYKLDVNGNIRVTDTLIIGEDSSRYRFPESAGSEGQVLISDGSGSLVWSDTLGVGNNLQQAYNAGNEIELTAQNGDIRMYSTSPPSEFLFLEAQTGNVGIGDTTPSYKLDVNGKGRFTDSLTIGDYTMPVIQGESDQVLAINASGNPVWKYLSELLYTCVMWAYEEDVVYTSNDANCDPTFLGISKGAVNNVYGTSYRNTHVNLGGYSQTGTDEFDYKYCTVSGGEKNYAMTNYSTIAGGDTNVVKGEGGFIGGGKLNLANRYYSTVGGGESDTADAVYGGVFSGYQNRAGNSESDTAIFIGGGYKNRVEDDYSVICGGDSNIVVSRWSFIGGGKQNLAEGALSAIAGGEFDTVIGIYGGVFSGHNNLAGNEEIDTAAFVGGGWHNKATSMFSTIAGGKDNLAHSPYSSVGGGLQNTADSLYTTVSGGRGNYAHLSGATVGGGEYDTASFGWATVGGGYENKAGNIGASVCGGTYNKAIGYISTICGGYANFAGDDEEEDSLVFIGGGKLNYALANYSAIGGGARDSVLGDFGGVFCGLSNLVGDEEGDTASFIGGGWDNVITSAYSTVGGGVHDSVLGVFGGVFSGFENKSGITEVDSAAFVGGGGENKALAWYSVVCGGYMNIDSTHYGFIGGGKENTILNIADYSVIAGGRENTTEGVGCVISGGYQNEAIGNNSVVGGGEKDTVTSIYGGICSGYNNIAGEATTDTGVFIGGGSENVAIGSFATIGAGKQDSVIGDYGGIFSGYSNLVGDDSGDTASFIGGGWDNVITSAYSTIAGGYRDSITADSATIAGGVHNKVYGMGGTIGGGSQNVVRAICSTIGGGYKNSSTGSYTAIGGGDNNIVVSDSGGIFSGYSNVAGDAVSDVGVFIGGGGDNEAIAPYSTIGGGENNEVNSKWSGIFSGKDNIAGRGTTDYGIFIGGGVSNEARLDYSTISGGYDNTIGAVYSTIGGGYKNSTTSTYTTISGGSENTIDISCNIGTIGGGRKNRIDDACYGGTIAGGDGNIITSSCVDSFQTIAGGTGNQAEAQCCIIGGGRDNQIYRIGNYSTICGGYDNYIDGEICGIVGGDSNRIEALINNTSVDNSGILGGKLNKIKADAPGGGLYAKAKYTCILGGHSNFITATGANSSSDFSAIVGGYKNRIKAETDGDNLTSEYSVILGGYSNEIENSDFCIAFGNDITIEDDYVTVFYNSTNSGKVGINEESPEKELHVNGTVYINDILKLEPTSAPTTGEEGMIYYNDEEDHLYLCIEGGTPGTWKKILDEDDLP